MKFSREVHNCLVHKQQNVIIHYIKTNSRARLKLVFVLFLLNFMLCVWQFCVYSMSYSNYQFPDWTEQQILFPTIFVSLPTVFIHFLFGQKFASGQTGLFEDYKGLSTLWQRYLLKTKIPPLHVLDGLEKRPNRCQSRRNFSSSTWPDFLFRLIPNNGNYF
jgi:uncharacterized membrane protein YhdT